MSLPNLEIGVFMDEKIREAKKLLRNNGYVVVKWTPSMEKDADECERMSMEGKMKYCCGCSCAVCLIQ